MLGCDVPLMQAPLGRGAGARLAIEVSQSVGLGTLGASWTEPAILREQIRSIARATTAVCVNLVLDVEQEQRLEGGGRRARAAHTRFPGAGISGLPAAACPEGEFEPHMGVIAADVPRRGQAGDDPL